MVTRSRVIYTQPRVVEKMASPAGNRTPVSRVTGGDTYHYTTEDTWSSSHINRIFLSYPRTRPKVNANISKSQDGPRHALRWVKFETCCSELVTPFLNPSAISFTHSIGNWNIKHRQISAKQTLLLLYDLHNHVRENIWEQYDDDLLCVFCILSSKNVPMPGIEPGSALQILLLLWSTLSCRIEHFGSIWR